VFVNFNQITTTTKILKRICSVIAPEVEALSTGLATSEYYQQMSDVLNEFNFDGGISRARWLIRLSFCIARITLPSPLPRLTQKPFM
jgi:hypothetical protein